MSEAEIAAKQTETAAKQALAEKVSVVQLREELEKRIERLQLQKDPAKEPEIVELQSCLDIPDDIEFKKTAVEGLDMSTIFTLSQSAKSAAPAANNSSSMDEDNSDEEDDVHQSIEGEEESLFVEEEKVDPRYGPSWYRGSKAKNRKNLTTVAWFNGNFINKSGPKNAPRYRIENNAADAKYEEELPPNEKISNKKNRFGEVENDAGKHKYTKRHVDDILGVAWAVPANTHPDNELDLLDPSLVDSTKRGRKFVETRILIRWDIEGKLKVAWETRTTMRRLYKKDGDQVIYDAACDGESRCEQVTGGTRYAKDRSPSVGLASKRVKRFREQSLRASPARSSLNRSTRSSPASARSTAADMDILKKALESFRLDYCELLGVDSIADLDAVEKKDLVEAWQHRKAELELVY
jgi:hypothetical protein